MKKRVVSMILCVVLCVALWAPYGTIEAEAARIEGVNLTATVDGSAPVTIKAYQFSYENNLLVSLRDLAAALADTPKAFSLSVVPDEEMDFAVQIYRENPYVLVGGENRPQEMLKIEDYAYGAPDYHKLLIDDQQLKIPTFIHEPDYGVAKDVYLRLVDVGMYLDINISFTGEREITIDTGKSYDYDLYTQVESGYFRHLHSILLADADTGKILYEHNGDIPTAIASTTKLFTYLLVKEALDRGEFTEDTLYTVSYAAYREANAEDGIYSYQSNCGSLDLGSEVTVRDLMYAMLLRSSNEASTALAEVVAGTEWAFVEQMNQRAEELGLDSAVFYNPHGLPNYNPSNASTKLHNEMSAMDMFRLTQYLLENHGEHLTAITTQKRAELPTFGTTPDGEVAYAVNTNAHLYNFEGCLGLKTGTTNRAGKCLVCVLPVTDMTGQTHNLVVTLFGGEDDFERYEKTGWLLKYAQQYYSQNPYNPIEPPVEETEPTAAQTEPTTVPTELTQPEAQSLLPGNPTQAFVLGGLSGIVVTAAVALIITAIKKRRCM